MNHSIALSFIIPTIVLLSMSGCGRKAQKQSTNIPSQVTPHTAMSAQETAPKQPSKLVEQMNFQEAQHARRYYETYAQQDMLIKLLERMIIIAPNPQEKASLILTLAQTYETEEDLKNAKKWYEQFIADYPGNPHIQEARYKFVYLNFLNEPPITNDQTITYTTIELGKAFLSDFSQVGDYHPHIHSIMHASYKRLLGHELATVAFYLDKFNYTQKDAALTAAQTRLEYIRKKLLPVLARSVAGMREFEELLNNAAQEYEEDKKTNIPLYPYAFIEQCIHKLHTLLSADVTKNTPYKNPRDTF